MMRKKQTTIILISILIIFSLTSSVSAFFPLTHKYLQNKLLEDYTGDSIFYQQCVKYPDACYVGNVLTDISVAWYFVNGGEKYIITHSPAFARAMIRNAVGDVEEACAVGAALHSTQDYQSHNYMVPYSIKVTGLPNSVVHVFAEQHLDNIVVNKYPNVKYQMNLLSNDSWNKCIPLVKKTLKGYSEYQETIKSGELDNVINTFVAEVQTSILPDKTGYDISFKNKVSIFGRLSFVPIRVLILYLISMFLFILMTILLVFRKQKSFFNYISLFIFGFISIFLVIFLMLAMFGQAFSTFTIFIKPFSNFVPIGSSDTHLNEAVQNGIDFFNQGEQWLIDKENPDASGFSTLKTADKSSKYVGFLLIGFFVLLLALAIYFNFRRKKYGKIEKISSNSSYIKPVRANNLYY